MLALHDLWNSPPFFILLFFVRDYAISEMIVSIKTLLIRDTNTAYSSLLFFYLSFSRSLLAFKLQTSLCNAAMGLRGHAGALVSAIESVVDRKPIDASGQWTSLVKASSAQPLSPSLHHQLAGHQRQLLQTPVATW